MRVQEEKMREREREVRQNGMDMCRRGQNENTVLMYCQSQVCKNVSLKPEVIVPPTDIKV